MFTEIATELFFVDVLEALVSVNHIHLYKPSAGVHLYSVDIKLNRIIDASTFLFTLKQYVLRELPSSPVPASCCNALLEACRKFLV